MLTAEAAKIRVQLKLYKKTVLRVAFHSNNHLHNSLLSIQDELTEVYEAAIHFPVNIYAVISIMPAEA